MKDKKTEAQFEDEMLPEYDFRKMTFVGRGIYAERYRAGTRIFLSETDTGEYLLKPNLSRRKVILNTLNGD